MFAEFSSGYYFGRLYVEPRDGGDESTGVIHRDQHERLAERLYATGEGVERLDAPLVMKLGRTHFPVVGDTGIPADTLGLPDALLDGAACDPPSLCEVFLAKADRATQLLRTAGWQPNAEAAA
jgi:hypothetical protein